MPAKFKPCTFNNGVASQYKANNGVIYSHNCKNTEECKKCGWNPEVAKLRLLAANDKNNWKKMYKFNEYGIIVKQYKSLNVGDIKIE